MSDYLPLNPAGVDGRFWYVNSAGLVCSDGEVPEDFSLELLEPGRLAIRGKNGKYLRGDQGGTLKGDGHSLSSSALWEYWFNPVLVLTRNLTMTLLVVDLTLVKHSYSSACTHCIPLFFLLPVTKRWSQWACRDDWPIRGEKVKEEELIQPRNVLTTWTFESVLDLETAELVWMNFRVFVLFI